MCRINSLSLETVRSNWLKLRSMRQSPDRGLDWVHFPAEVGDLLIILLCTTIYSEKQNRAAGAFCQLVIKGGGIIH